MKTYTFGIIILSMFLFCSCQYKEVNADAQTYCNCKTRQYTGNSEPGECSKLLASLKEKYEYLPEQYEILANRIAECITEKISRKIKQLNDYLCQKKIMKVFHGLDNGFSAKHPVVTIGTFDGVHLGHQKILQKINKEAEKVGGESVLFTFHPHPRMVLNPDNHDLKLLQTQEEKIGKLARIGLQNLIIYPFTTEFSNLTALEFVRDILVKEIKVKTLVIGYDHQFGKNREGGIEFLQSVSEEFGFSVIEIPVQEINDVNISSTKIRNALLDGNIALANSFLTDSFELTGKVIKGQALGRKLGFPTANLDLETDLKLIPQNGVYAVEVNLTDGRQKKGIMNIGSRPTIHANGQLSLEVYLLDFNEDLYGQTLVVQFLEKIRKERTFANTDELIEQIKKDEKHARSIFAAHTL